MKKQLFKHPMLFLIFAWTLFAGTTLQAQTTYHADDKADLRAFLRQPSATPADPTTNNRWNGGCLGLTPADTANWQTDETWVTQVLDLTWNDDTHRRLTRIGANGLWVLKGLAGSLNLSGCTALTGLYCSRNSLTTLEVSKNTALTRLDCGSNQLTVLDVGKNTALTVLNCSSNQLTTLDVSKNMVLTLLSCATNQLTALDVGKNTALTVLSCYLNSLTALDVSKNTVLTYLNCSGNQLTTLDVSKNTALTELDCGNNQLTALDVSKNTALTQLYCYENQLTALDVGKNTALTALYCFGNQLTTLDVGKNIALTRLYCDNNQLTALDVGKNTALTDLYCYFNSLTVLDVGKNTALTELGCNDNQLTALDVSKNTALTWLDCSYNRMPLIYLYDISQKMSNVYNKYLGLQQPVHFTDTTLVAGSPLDFSDQNEFGGIKTAFAVKKNTDNALENIDYSLSNGIITFLTTGAYTVKMTNSAITSHADHPAKAITGMITVAETVYTITASVNGAGGSISPMGMVPVAENGDKTFTFTPDNGYAIDQVLINNVNNAEAAASGAYTFRNVTSNQSITVSFKHSAGIDGTEKENNGLNVYPNPVTNGALTIRIGAYTSSSKEVIAVYHISGKLMGTYPIAGSETIIDISHLPAGIYLVQAGGKRVKVVKN